MRSTTAHVGMAPCDLPKARCAPSVIPSRGEESRHSASAQLLSCFTLFGAQLEAVDGSLDVDDVELTRGVLPEGADSQSGLDGVQPRPGVARVANQPPDPAAAIIGE